MGGLLTSLEFILCNLSPPVFTYVGDRHFTLFKRGSRQMSTSFESRFFFGAWLGNY